MMTELEKDLLDQLRQSRDNNAFAMACDGECRAPAHSLEKKGFAIWRGELWGSKFWSITDDGYRAAVDGKKAA
jgi:hypothetical protein